MKQSVKTYLQKIKHYIIEHNEQVIGIAITAGVIAIIAIIALVSHLSGPQIVYQPVKSCDLLTPAEAQTLLGDKIIGVDSKDPSITGDVATSKCSYTDGNPDKAQMVVAAVAVRSAINDEGVTKNTDDFAASQANNDTDTVTGIGEKAYFNKTSGQLNILSNKSWIIISYGIGENPAANSPEKAVQLAKLVVS